MFGAYRLTLALFVILTHIGGIEVIAGIGVWGFFMLSGYLITGVLNTRYGFNGPGLVGFWTSRALRLYPTYWLICGMTFLLITLGSPLLDPQSVNTSFGPLSSLREWLSAIFIFGHTTLGVGRVEHALSPSIWAVDVELLMYIVSCLFLSRSIVVARTTTILLFMAFPALWYVAKGIIRAGDMETGGQLIYSFLPAALLPYGIGATLWFYKERLKPLRPTWPRFGFIALLLSLLVAFSDQWSITATYILSLPVLAFAMTLLANAPKKARLKRIDDVMGHMSYPVYLTHFACAYAVLLGGTALGIEPHLSTLTEIGKHTYTPQGLLAVIGVCFGVSFVIARLVEAPMDDIRHRAAKAAMHRLRTRR